MWGWLIDYWSWANGKAVLQYGKSLYDMPVRELVDATFALMIEWASLSREQQVRLQDIFKYFNDRETEYETGVPVLPGWASVGNVAAQYGLDDADPFSVVPEQEA